MVQIGMNQCGCPYQELYERLGLEINMNQHTTLP